MRRTSPRLITSLAVCAAAAMAVGGLGAPAASAQQVLVPGSSFGFVAGDPGTVPLVDPASAEYRTQLIEATNAARVANGQKALTAAPALNTVATAWSQVQADANKMFHNPTLSSQIPDGASRWSENVLQNYRNATPQELVNQWMASPGHRINLLRSDHTTMGMGVAVSSSNKLYATQVFARY
ncbi:CAP domain-containing protein [Rhodococcus sp. IEGM 1408]|uniref:CAP domain-containing protein n=1 Tax=Rhodococcus sp. IEGM 1408 TaxID=3082220 RepID=UPI002953EDA5|nr:CAP domain-containing protein [Rhodococcus sp. IEGM 1408]MDV8002204.1 CAP domain-containing protein [Rhodococcus sp. IEGM 1408]